MVCEKEEEDAGVIGNARLSDDAGVDAGVFFKST
jgi:hypothetical protein